MIYFDLECTNLISCLLCIDPAQRLTIPKILLHKWLSQDEVSNNATPITKLGTTREEMVLAAKLKSIGVDVDTMLASVHGNTCDQLAAFWHLLLEKERGVTASSTPTIFPSSEMLKFSEPDLINDTILISANVEHHFQNAINKSPANSDNPLLEMSRIQAVEDKQIQKQELRSAQRPQSASAHSADTSPRNIHTRSDLSNLIPAPIISSNSSGVISVQNGPMLPGKARSSLGGNTSGRAALRRLQASHIAEEE